MSRKIVILGFFCLFLLNLFAIAEDKAAGYALLEKIVSTFREMAEKGTGGEKIVNPALQEMMAEAKKAKAQGQLDPVFYRRFTRILMVMKLFVIPNDPEGILSPLIEREISEFVADVKGEIESEIKGTKGVGIVADALTEEILNLRLYLDTKEDKAKLMEKFRMKSAIETQKK